MAKLKLYRVVCSIYDDNNKIFQVPLSDLLGRYEIKPIVTKWGINHDLEKLITHFVYSGVKVKYEYGITYVKTYDDYEIPEFHTTDLNTLGNLADWMNFEQQKITHRMTESDFLKLAKGYGNNYITQIKGGNT